MNRQEFILDITKTYEEGIEIIKRKNSDYAGTGDPFKNFNSCDPLGISPEKAILVRVMDKIVRVSNLLTQEAAVKDEAMEDTLLDAINYLAILRALIHSKQ